MSTDQTAQPTLPAGLPDDWRLDRDVACPKCGYNLRMMRAPRCPECGADHRWQELLEISCPRCAHALTGVNDAVCPRCGLELKWAALLDDSAIHSHNFEYDSDPLRSAVRTGFRSLFPRRMWRHFALETEPRLKRLLPLRRIALGVAVTAILFPVVPVISWYFSSGNVTGWPLHWVVDRLVGEIALLCGLILAPIAATAVLLPRFTPTLSSFQIRREQLLRVFTYGRFAWLWSGIALLGCHLVELAGSIGAGLGWVNLDIELDFVGAWLSGYGFNYPWYWWDWGRLLSLALMAMFLALGTVWWWRFLYVALHDYLRINRRNTIALIVSTQSVAWLSIALIIVLVNLLLLGLRVGW